ncbi:ATP-binding cassette domain-containing protein [bacterium]|nr:ATP-binding cassette domain-containing protein [bacterium]
MLKCHNISKSYGKQVLFEGTSLQLNPGERLGLVGRNGHGKSTLFKLILKQEGPDDGDITVPKNYRIGHLEQHIHFTKPTVLEEACTGLTEEDQYDHWKVEAILFGLGFTKKDMDRNPGEFSGGFQIRINLAKVLASNPNLLLLDEPTNYLDIVSIRWITQFLNDWPNELIIISHDREFMDSVTTHTALIHRGKIRKVEGGTEKLYAQVEQDEETYEKTRLAQEKQRKHAEDFINKFRAQAGRAAMVQSRIKMLDKMPEVEELSTIKDLDFKFHYELFEAKTLMEINDLSFAYDKGPLLIPKVNLMVQAKDRIVIIGKNGKGKSTLLNLMAGELKPLTGTVSSHPKTKLGYFGQTNIARLNPKNTIEREIDEANPKLGRTAVKSICGCMMFSGETADKKISSLSGGEKSRVLLGKILATPANLLFLDEPTNHLDMQSIEALTQSIEEFDGAVVIVTHNEEILRRVATKLVIFHHGIVDVFPGSYDDFLEKIGWEEEDPDDAQPVETPSQIEQKVKREKADIINERSKVTSPLKHDMSVLENEITQFEKELARMNEDLIKASQEKNTAVFAELSKKIKDTQKQIETRFSKLEDVSKKLDEQNAKFEGLLKELT